MDAGMGADLDADEGRVSLRGCREQLAFFTKRRLPAQPGKIDLAGLRIVSSWLATMAAVAFLFCGGPASAEGAAATITAPWLAHARIAGAELFSEMTHREIERNLATLADQNVSVIEAD